MPALVLVTSVLYVVPGTRCGYPYGLQHFLHHLLAGQSVWGGGLYCQDGRTKSRSAFPSTCSTPWASCGFFSVVLTAALGLPPLPKGEWGLSPQLETCTERVKGWPQEAACLSVLGLLSQSPQTREGIKTTGVYSLPVLEASSLKSKCWRDWFLPPREDRSWSFLLELQQSLACVSFTPISASIFMQPPHLCLLFHLL